MLIAAVGNFGPKSPPQYPGRRSERDRGGATDADDKLFVASNRGSHVAIAAPGVDILLPAPDAELPGHVRHLVRRRPCQRDRGADPRAQARPPAGRGAPKSCISTAKDLGPRGKDDQFGAGLADAYQAILALEPRTAPAGAQNLRGARGHRALNQFAPFQNPRKMGLSWPA